MAQVTGHEPGAGARVRVARACAGATSRPRAAARATTGRPSGPGWRSGATISRGPRAPRPTRRAGTSSRPARRPNGELEYYTDRRDNSFVDGSGNLVLRAVREASWASRTRRAGSTRGDLREFTYGRFEARLKVPAGRGYWPAFWLLGSNGSSPACGEMDGMELGEANPRRATARCTVPNFFGGGALTKQYSSRRDHSPTTFHVFAIEWTHDGMRWLVDDEPFHVGTRADCRGSPQDLGLRRPFSHHPEPRGRRHVRRPPRARHRFPGDLVVDYVEVSRLDP